MATITTPGAAQAWRPDVEVFAAEDKLPEALYVTATQKAGVIEGDAPSVRVAFINDADTAQFTAEGAQIAEDDAGLDEVLVFTRKITRLVNLSVEQYRQTGTSDRLGNSLKRDLVRKSNRALLTQAAPVSPAVAPAAGLYNTAGIVNAGEVDLNLDAIVDAVAELQANDSVPRLLIVDPIASARLAKLKDSSTSNRGLLSPDATAGNAPSIHGLQVVVSNALATGTGLIVDPTAIASAYGAIELSSSHDQRFSEDIVVIKATWRVGHNLVHPDRIAKLTVADPDA